MKKIYICLISIVMLLIFAGCGSGVGGYTSNEPCVWCDGTPTKKIKSETEDIEAYNYCKECSTTCFGCGEPATEHYTNLLGAEVFACDDCYY